MFAPDAVFVFIYKLFYNLNDNEGNKKIGKVLYFSRSF